MQKPKQFAVTSNVKRFRRTSGDPDGLQHLEAEIATGDAPTGVALQLTRHSGIEFFVCAHEHNSLTIAQWGSRSAEVRIPHWALHVPEDGSTPAPVVLDRIHRGELALTIGDAQHKATARLVLDRTSRSGVVLELEASGKGYVVQPYAEPADDEGLVDIGWNGLVQVPAGALDFAL